VHVFFQMRGVLTPNLCVHPSAVFVMEAEVLAMGCESAGKRVAFRSGRGSIRLANML